MLCSVSDLAGVSLPVPPFQVFAFQAKMLHDKRFGNDSLLRRWQDVRLRWAAIADVLMTSADGVPTASPDNGYGLWLYDEPYEITGLSVSREQWAFYEVFGLFRLAVIAQQIYYRYHHGQTTNEAYAGFLPVVQYLEQRCTALIGAAGGATG